MIDALHGMLIKSSENRLCTSLLLFVPALSMVENISNNMDSIMFYT